MLEQFKAIFQVGKTYTISFSDHVFDITIVSVKKASVSTLLVKPAKRTREDGKQYTPPCTVVETTSGDLVFVNESTVIRETLREVLITVGNATGSVTLCVS